MKIPHSVSRWLAASLVFAAFHGEALAQDLAIDDLLGAPTAPEPTSLAEMLARLDALSAEFENAKDVKCWTSMGQLETFVAGADFSPEATHAKSEVLLGYFDQLWREAATAGSGPIPAEVLEAADAKHFPAETIGLSRVDVRIGDRILEIPYRDTRDYEGTIEPLRLLRTATERAARSDPGRAPLSNGAIHAARRVISQIATVVLRESSSLARENRHERVEESDVVETDRRIAKAVGLRPDDPSKRVAVAVDVSSTADTRATMRAVIQSKIRSLDVFNTRYSKDVLGIEFDADLTKHEREWAQMPVNAEASRFYKEDSLVAVADRLYRQSAKEHPHSDPLTGPEVLETLTRLYPHANHIHGVTVLFPHADTGRTFWVSEHIADAFRDSAWHWKALDRAVEQAESKGGAGLPSLDLYAMEEISEFVSIYAVALVQTAGLQARSTDAKEVSATSIRSALALFEKNRRIGSVPDRVAGPKSREQWERAAVVARTELERSFVAEPFSDVTALSGIDFSYEESQLVEGTRFAHLQKQVAADGSTRIVSVLEPPAMQSPTAPLTDVGLDGGGVAVADVDGDGRLDVYLVSGTRDRLYRNLGGLRFEDVTEKAGLASADPGRGAYFVDYDNDGDPDLFVTQVHAPNRLFRNKGSGTFEDVTERVGLPLRRDLVTHSATWFDFDNDGHLDVYVGNYGNWLAGTNPQIHHSRNGQPDQLFRNRGDGTFEDISERAQAGSTGWAHAVSHFDANGDGWQDLFVANDFGYNELLVNQAGARLVDVTPDTLRERSLHGMSVGFTDVNRDGIEDIYVSNIATFSFVSKYIKPGEKTELRLTRRTVEDARMIENNLFLVSGGGTFAERQHEYFDRSERGDGWAWDADFFDFDNDGLEDLYVANGREPGLPYDRERNVLYRQSNGRFFDVSRGSGADIPENSRGAAAADLDGDGDLDLIVNNYKSHATLLRNNLRRHHWIQIQLRGTRGNRDGIGARVVVSSAAGAQTRTVRGGSGYLSQDPTTLHFGLGDASDVERVEVRWPGGTHQVLENLAADRLYRIEEPAELAAQTATESPSSK